MTTIIFITNRIKLQRGISQVVASLIMLAIVATFGTVFLIQGMEGISTFNSTVEFFKESQTKAAQESIIIEHVTFYPSNTTVSFWIRNTGVIEVTVDRITMVKVDTQDLIIENSTVTNTIFVKELEEIRITPLTIPSSTNPDQWDSNHDVTGISLNSSEYRISITTARGNSFEAIAKPFNT